MSLVVIYTTVIILLSDEPTGCQLPNVVLDPVIDVPLAVFVVMNPILVCRLLKMCD